MAKEVIDGAGSKAPIKKLRSRNPIIDFDKLKLYFREPYIIDLDGVDGSITLYQPSLGDVVSIGEKRFYSTLNVFTTNTTAFRLQLWEQGLDWNEISDFELFILLVSTADKDVYNVFIPNINFENFEKFMKTDSNTGEQHVVLYDQANKIEINETVYFHISQYLRTVFNINPEEKFTKDKTMKKWFIQKDRKELENKQHLKDDNSSILSLISGCVNHPGFKYKSSELKELGIYEFYDSVKRLQVYESTTALQKGMYSGFMDSSKIKPDDYNFMRPI